MNRREYVISDKIFNDLTYRLYKEEKSDVAITTSFRGAIANDSSGNPCHVFIPDLDSINKNENGVKERSFRMNFLIEKLFPMLHRTISISKSKVVQLKDYARIIYEDEYDNYMTSCTDLLDSIKDHYNNEWIELYFEMCTVQYLYNLNNNDEILFNEFMDSLENYTKNTLVLKVVKYL